MPPPKIGSGTAPKTPTALAGKKKQRSVKTHDFTIQRRGQQREHHKNNRVNEKKTTTLHDALHFFVHFFPVFALLRRENA